MAAPASSSPIRWWVAEAGGNVGEVFPLPVARASPPLPERVGPGLKPPWWRWNRKENS